jgi:hypothetical protein
MMPGHHHPVIRSTPRLMIKIPPEIADAAFLLSTLDLLS